MKITGELLKSERNRKGLSVQDVAFALKLSQKIISSIEAGETEELPAKTFIRGFVKSYAQFLKMDVDQVMRQFLEEMGSTHPLPKGATPPPNAIEIQSKTVPEFEPARKNKTSKASSTPSHSSSEQTKVLNSQTKGGRSLVYIGVAVVLVILIVATNKVVERYQKESVLDPSDVSKVQPLNPNEPQAVSAPASTPNSETGTTSTQPTVPIENNRPDSNLMSTPSTQAIQPTSTPPTSSVSEAEVDAGFEPSAGKPIEIIVEAKKDTEILYARGNTKSFSRLKLTAKQVQVIRSTTGLHLKADDGGSFHMVVNGIEKGAAGANNKPVRLSF